MPRNAVAEDPVPMNTVPDAAAPVPQPELVRLLLHDQAPDLAHLHIRPSPASGSSNWVFRVGETLTIRMPRSSDYVVDLENEVAWLPHLAPGLPAAVPEIVVVGQPSDDFPRPWSVVSWLPGELPLALGESRRLLLAESLGEFLQSLHDIDVTDVAPGPERWGYRCGEPVTDTIDSWTEQAAAELTDLFDPTSVRTAWQRLRDVPPASEAPCWVHTDMSEENVLVHEDGQLAGVIDFGGIGVGDRSIDLLYA